jgi:lipid II isoglutaminyl synthase (glutamine-hydrolysing)
VSAARITLGYLYPDIMSGYGERGNVETIVRRCEWRGVEVTLCELRPGDPVRPGELDLIMIGGASESRQRLVAADLWRVKGPGIRDAVARGAAVLASGRGFELFGRFCQPGSGPELHGIDVFDAWTIRPSRPQGDHYDTVSAARADRAIGELAVRWRGTLLAGFENHGGSTHLGPGARPLGRVIAGYGNNGDGTEGVIRGSAVGTNLRGPCLPANPALADFLIRAALSRRLGRPVDRAELRHLADELEHAAHRAAVRRARMSARRGRGTRVPAIGARARVPAR